MYTVETLIPDCVGRYITSDTGSVQLVNLINGRTYAKCWQALLYWVLNQYELGNSTNLAPLGLLIRNQSNERGRKGNQKNSQFRFLREFVQQNELQVKAADILDHEDETSAIKMNISTLAKLAGVPTQTYRIALSHLFRRLGEVLGNKEQVLIDFSVGSLVGDKGQVEFLFHDAPDEQKVIQSQYQLTILLIEREYLHVSYALNRRKSPVIPDF